MPNYGLKKKYLKELSGNQIYKVFIKGKSNYRAQRIKDFKNILVKLSDIPNPPSSLFDVNDNHISELINELSKNYSNSSIANYISFLRKGLAYIGISFTTSAPKREVKKLHQSKFYRVKEKI